MASFLRSKQAGMQNDLSAAIQPHLFAPDEQSRFGINSQISCVAYDPVQSLVAVGTGESRFGLGMIYVFGRRRVQKFIQPGKQASIRFLSFVGGGDRLVSLDSRNELAVWKLDTAERVCGYANTGPVAAMVTDPMLDWVLLGLTSGDVMAFDLDRGRMATTFRLPNFWKQRDARARLPHLVSMQMHPRDIGQLLIGYNHGAAIYSFKQAQAIRFFEYELPPGAPGGNADKINTARRPRLTHAVWHPTGTFVLTAHDDGSLVFWDPKDGRVVAARSLYDTNVDQPTTGAAPRLKLLDSYTKVAWCCKQNPDDTGLLIAGGLSHDAPEKGLTFLELGPTPIYATSSWQVLADHFKGRRQHLLQSPPGTDITQFYLVPRSSPYFDYAQDPIAILTLLSSGEMLTMSFPSGYPISPTNQLHPSLSFVHPFVLKVAVSTLSPSRWGIMIETRNQGELLLKGGAEGSRPRRNHKERNILQVAHADGTVRIWDAGRGDLLENPSVVQVDVARATGRFDGVEVSAMALGPNTGEFAAGTRTGEVVIYRWAGNRTHGRENRAEEPSEARPGELVDISHRTEPALADGLQPFALYQMLQGAVAVVQVSDVGFVAAGSENGFVSIIDMRGPKVILQASVAEFAKQEKRSSFIKGHSSSKSPGGEWPVVIEFGVMTLEGDSYSSIACFVGTNLGRVATFKLLPGAEGGGYSAQPAGVTNLGDKIISISPIVADTGRPAVATAETVAGLRTGQQVNGTLVVATQTQIRIFKPASAKGASKSFDDVFCDAAAVAELEMHGFALVGVFGDRTTRAYSLPALKEINRAALPMLDPARTVSALVTPTGDIFGWAGPSELVVVPVWGTAAGAGASTARGGSNDTLVDPSLAVPPRPTISNMQWLSGTQHVSPADLDALIGGPDRPPSKRMVEAAAEEARVARAGGGGSGGAAAAGGQQEGWGDYLTRQLQERTEKLNIMGDSVQGLEGSSKSWADDTSKFVAKQKRSFIMGAIKGKFM